MELTVPVPRPSAAEAAPAIAVTGLNKAYRIWSDPAQRLVSPMLTEASRLLPGSLGRRTRERAQAGYRDFFALKDVSFEVKRGEAVGIIGRNGAGKSTLLQIIAGTLQPTSGRCRATGRVAALLELGAGFNTEFTGRENVFLSGAVLGLSKAEVTARFNEIAAFADIGEFIEQPVKTYSSGMMMRLAFAVNTCVDPDILIVDEALGVGDAPFQAKCFRRLRQLIDKGVTLLFVSHDIGTVRSICSRALWLKNGRAEMWGEAKTVAKEYEKFCWKEQGIVVADQPDAPKTSAQTNAATQAPLPVPTEGPPELWQPNPVFAANRSRARVGTGAVIIRNLLLANSTGEITTAFEYDDLVTFHYSLELNEDVDSDFILSVRFRDLKGNFVYAAHDVECLSHLRAKKGSRIWARTAIRVPLHHQGYSLHVAIFGFQSGEAFHLGTYDFSQSVFWDVIEEAAFIEIKRCKTMPLPGPVHVHAPLTFTVVP